MKRKILSLILVFAMTVSLLTVGTGAVEPTYGDTAGHWAESSIERWSAYGIIQGSNGQFDPNGQLTCAQLATILAKLLKLPAAKDAGFTDNTADAWYYDAINRCAAAGILNGNGDGTVTPEAPITRERAMVMLARALGIEPIRKPDLTKYTDAAQVSAYAQGYVAALIEAGIVGGVTADELAPQDNITRAATVTILDRAISTYADKAGATVKADGKGIVLVVAENVKITGAPEGTKIVVADGATGLTVNGKSVSDDQTYIVPKTTTSSGSSSGGYSHSHTWVDNYCNGCGQFKDTVVAAIGKKGYETVAAAITAANGSGTVTLLKATTETIQEILDGQYGSIDGLTIELPTGNYGQLELGRATKYPGSGTTYHIGGFDKAAMSFDDFYARKNDGTYSASSYYIRTMSNVTLKAADGASVKIAGVNASSGHKYANENTPPVYDYVLGKQTMNGSSHYLANVLENITFDGLTFTAKSDINTSIPESTINGFTFKNCKFDLGSTASGNQAIRYYNENNNGKVSNLVVDNCKFNNCYQGVYTSHIKNIIVTNSEFDTTGHNAIAIQDFKGACDHGKVIITGNTFKNIGDRIIRFNTVGADTQITITHNTADNNSGKKAENTETREVIAAVSLAEGVTRNIHHNSWGDGATFGTGFTDETGEPCAEINGVKYISLAKALAAAQDGDTVKLTQDITPDERIVVTGNKNITIDLAEKKITSTADVAIVNDGNGKLTITGNGTVDTSSSTNDENIAIWARTGSIDIENGTFINKSNKEATVYVGTSENANEPVITIKGGTFKNSAEGTYTYNSSLKPLTLNVQNGKPVTSIVITGGTFYGNDPKNGDDNKGGTFLAPDYKSVETSAGSGVWTVSKMTWNEYPEDASVVPSGLLIQEYTNGDFNSNNGNTGTITIKDKEALLYFAYKLNPAAAHEACLADHSHWDHTCIWYGGACARHIVLNADIDLENITLENGFGNMKDFDFDGQDHKISSVTINYNGTDNTGLFVGGNRGISNLVVENVKVNAPNGTENAVGIVSSDANADITNVTVRNSSVTGGKYTGAIVGYNYGSVANCKVENCTVSGRYKVGGIIGYICNSNDVPTYVTGNVLTGVTVKGENLVAGKNNFVIGKIVGNWNATVGECSGNTFSGTTVATEDIGEIESRCIVTVNGVTQLPQNATAETINKVITESKDAEGNVVKDVKLALPSKSTFELNNGLAHEGDKSRKVTIVGDGTQTVDVAKNAAKAEGANHLNYQRGSTFTFENVTVENGTGTYDGIVCDELIYRNCTIKGVTTLYGKATFIDCTFENEMANQYSIWTWGGTDVKFEGCTFNTNGKAILLFGEEKTTNLTVTGCRFNDRNNGTAGKAAIEIGEANYGKHNNFTVVISDSEVVTGFAINSNGTNTGSKLWANKNSMDSEHLSVTIDGTKVL